MLCYRNQGLKKYHHSSSCCRVLHISIGHRQGHISAWRKYPEIWGYMEISMQAKTPKAGHIAGPGSDSGSGSDSDSDSGSDSGSSSETDSELRLLRPIFLKKKQHKSKASHDLARTALTKAEHLQQIDAKTLEKVPFDGVDDGDDLEPEEEYNMWKQREASRKKRDAQLLAEIELAKEDAVRRRKGTVKSGLPPTEQPIEKDPQIGSKLGAFYVESVDEKFTKRDYKDVEGLEDHSRPTKYKRS